MRASTLAPVLLFALGASGCLRAWDVGGPWACDDNQVCPETFTCDDGLCCKPGGSPACPTLPLPGGGCAEGEPRVYFQDVDGDGDGNEKVSRVFCRAPRKPGWVLTGRDCDDTRPDIFFGAPELCNGKDDNCDRRIDELLPNLTPFFRDEDGDGVGAADAGLLACMAPPGFTALSGDCAPLDPTKFPGAVERCNNLDDDCDGVPDTMETTFADTDSASTNRFPCAVSNAQGVCRPGTFRCVASAGTVSRVCRSSSVASTEVCDGLDNNCNGAVDEGPDCGGPRTLLGAPGVTYRAQRLSITSQLNTSCQANISGTPSSVSADGRVWNATGTGYHVWSAEAPAGTFWDLSRLEAELRLSFTSPAGGNWGSPDAGAPFNPVVYLCGAVDTDIIRYRIVRPPDSFQLSDTSFDKVLPLNNSSAVWLVGTGSGFDTKRVKRIEVVIFTQAASFTITFNSTTGMGP